MLSATKYLATLAPDCQLTKNIIRANGLLSTFRRQGANQDTLDIIPLRFGKGLLVLEPFDHLLDQSWTSSLTGRRERIHVAFTLTSMTEVLKQDRDNR